MGEDHGYAKSQHHRKRIKEAFVWANTVRGMAQTVYRGLENCDPASS